MIPKEKVEAIVSKHNSIEKDLASGNIDPKSFAEKSKEYAELGVILKNAKGYLNFKNDKNDLENIINDVLLNIREKIEFNWNTDIKE